MLVGWLVCPYMYMYYISTVDIPGTSLRTATISGQHENCLRAKQMVEEMVAEVTATDSRVG